MYSISVYYYIFKYVTTVTTAILNTQVLYHMQVDMTKYSNRSLAKRTKGNPHQLQIHTEHEHDTHVHLPAL